MASKLLNGVKKLFRGKKRTDSGLKVNPGAVLSSKIEIGPPDLAAYRKMRFDGQVSAGLAVIKLPVLSRTYDVEADSPEIASFVEKTIKPIYSDLLNKTLTALDYGFAPLELVWELDEAAVARVVAIKDPPPETITVVTDDSGDYAGLAQKPDRQVEPPRAFLFTHRRENGDNYGVSRLRPAHAYWRTKQIVYLFLNRYLERKGNPPVIVTYPPDTKTGAQGTVGDANGRVALEMGKKLLENSAVALPYVTTAGGEPAWSVDYLEDSPRAGMFLKYIEHLDRMILRSMFVPERILSSDGEYGSYALSKVHADIFLLSQDGLIADIENAINRQLIRPIVEFNFGRKASARLVIGRLSGSDRQLAEDVFTEMVRRGDAKPLIEPLARQLGVNLGTDNAGEPVQ
ncbi:MAG: hypothetical protein GY771_14145 [bacterium]|nr:hypothetical protein [bacterium]